MEWLNCWPKCTIPYSDQKLNITIYLPFQTKQTIPFGAAHNYLAYIKGYPPEMVRWETKDIKTTPVQVKSGISAKGILCCTDCSFVWDMIKNYVFFKALRSQSLFRGGGGLKQMEGGYVQIILSFPFYEAHFFADPFHLPICTSPSHALNNDRSLRVFGVFEINVFAFSIG